MGSENTIRTGLQKHLAGGEAFMPVTDMFSEITFDKNKDDTYIILNSRNGVVNWDGTALSGYQLIENDTKIYLYMAIQEKPETISVLKDENLRE